VVILRELALDPLTGDLRVTGGELSVLTGKEALAQRIAVRLRTFLGEWIFDITIGTPWFQNILGTRRREGLIQTLVRARVQNTPGVERVVTMTVSLNKQRVASISGKVLAEGGDGIPISFGVGV